MELAHEQLYHCYLELKKHGINIDFEVLWAMTETTDIDTLKTALINKGTF